ncbi:MAG: hypothetical protein JJE36_05820 [Coriobacteriia bacterium]|nr:hypothetical protein [Coriobacteriia bacterium]
MEENNKTIEILNTMKNVEYYPSSVEEVDMAKYTKFPLSRIPAMGTAFEPLVAAFQNVVNGGQASTGLYKVTIPKGGHLAEFQNGSGYLGSVLKGNGAVGGGQAILNPLVCNPTMLFMAVALKGIDKKLDIIQEIQQEIIGFLVQKEKSELKGDLNILTDILNNYKFNWDNDKFKNNNHNKVLDIKQSAERKIDFHKEQITSKINKKSFLHSDQEVKKRLGKIRSEFNDYRLALYLYSFSAFMEVVLLENHDSAYLEGVSNKIEEYSLRYQELYKKCYDLIEEYAKSSIQSHLSNSVAGGLKGAGKALTEAGKAITKVPVISKWQLDGTSLIKVGDGREMRASERTYQTMKQFDNELSDCVRPFIENISAVNRLYNQPVELLFDQENIYFSLSES